MGKRGNRIKKRNRKRKEAEENNRNRTATKNRVLNLKPPKGMPKPKGYEEIVAEFKEWRQHYDL